MFKPDVQLRMYEALKRISQYQLPEHLHKSAKRQYGVSGEEAIEMAYENVLFDAARTIKGIRKPKDRVDGK